MMVPEVVKCGVEKCFYNRESQCHAHAITVGHDEPACDTFAHGSAKSDKQGAGEVGACHVTKCTFNDSMYCHACNDITVEWSGNAALCTTYRSK